MSMRFRVDLSGDVELKKLMSEFEPKVQKDALKKALREGAKVILRGVLLRVPEDTGTLKKEIKVRAFKRSRKYRVGFTVGTAAGDFKGKAFYSAFQEYGWLPSGNKKANGGIKASQQLLREEKQFKRDGRYIAQIVRKKITAAKIHLSRESKQKVPAKKFIQKSFKENAEQVSENLGAEILKAMNQIIEKKGL